MKTIYKYPLRVTHQQNISLFKGANILSIQMQHGCIVAWALVDDKQPKEKRTITLVGTGHEVPADAGRFVDTVQEGEFVWHFFEALSNVH